MVSFLCLFFLLLSFLLPFVRWVFYFFCFIFILCYPGACGGHGLGGLVHLVAGTVAPATMVRVVGLCAAALAPLSHGVPGGELGLPSAPVDMRGQLVAAFDFSGMGLLGPRRRATALLAQLRGGGGTDASVVASRDRHDGYFSMVVARGRG